MYPSRLRRIRLHGRPIEIVRYRDRQSSTERSRSRLHRVPIRGDDNRGRTGLGRHVLHYDDRSRHGNHDGLSRDAVYILGGLFPRS